MSHTCQAVLFHCLDFRLTKEIHRWLREQKLLGDCDIVSVAGAGKDILEPKAGQVMLLKQIAASVELHKIITVILMQHSGCGAYKLAYNFTSPRSEKKQQLADMDKIEKIIKKKFPSLAVRKIWAQLLDEHGRRINFGEVYKIAREYSARYSN